MRLLYNKGDRPAQNDIEEGDDVYNLPDSKRYTKTHAGDIVQIDSSPLTGYKNLLINGDKRVNYRDFDGSSFVDGEYCWDRWKATATAMVQIVEEGNYIPDTEYTLSGDGVTTQQLTSPASGHWTIPEVPRTATEIQLELGDTATNFEQRSIALERSLCQRYYWTGKVNGKGQGVKYMEGSENYAFAGSLTFPTEMRTTPTITTIEEPIFENCTFADFSYTRHGFIIRAKTTESTKYRIREGKYAADAEIYP